MIMSDSANVRFFFSKIATSEFAVTGEKFEPSIQYMVNVNMGFGLGREERTILCRTKAMTYQQDKLLMVIEVGCSFTILPEDWQSMFDEENGTVVLPEAIGLHFASLAVSTVRGILHARTEGMLVQAAIIPAINVQALVKGDVKIEMKPTVASS